ncbi:hypothetical protein EGW08_021485 [Elysia chlorotica]|uniref:MARVEL domain-containing protein n=1 Tax=Elysia chlorotica TaxID=188477 RepID=A0A3S1BMV9_ELYCH|nr:hypothetical protein EGW08_021485 [Elysia chlorotica]
MMHPAFLFNLMGVFLLTLAFVLHIVCLTTPYYSVANMNGFSEEVVNIAKTDPSRLGISPLQLDEALKSLGGMTGGSINYGMWKFCLRADQGQQDIHLCALWKDETTFNKDNGLLKTMESEGWIRGVQAMAILGAIFLVFALIAAIVNVVVKSKGDRLRLLYLFILFFCATAAVFILIGDIIMSAKYDSAFDLMMSKTDNPPPSALYELFTGRFSLSWGFVLDIVSAMIVLLAGVAHFIAGRIANSSSGVV